MTFKKLRVVIIAWNLLTAQNLIAEETDQFTLPPYELQDIGPTTSRALYQIIERVINQTNSEILMLESKAAHSSYAASQLARRKCDTYIADLLYKNTGPGIPRWLNLSRIAKQSNSIMYKEKRPWRTVYWLVFSQSPLFVLGIAPTINMYGHHLGTDKLGHFFMMGHTYYKIYNYLSAHGKSPQWAHGVMVTYGQFLEETYLGILVNGVYSNADLAANYSGWKFYTNLTHEITIGNEAYPPILIFDNNRWHFSKSVNQTNLLKPFFGDHLNEAWNPCRYSFSRNQIRNQVKKRCTDWISYKKLTLSQVKDSLNKYHTWYGEEYGYWLPKKDAITLELCFNP